MKNSTTFHIIGEQQVHPGETKDCQRCNAPARAFDFLLGATKRAANVAGRMAEVDPKGAAALLTAATGAWESMMRLAPLQMAQEQHPLHVLVTR
jgi:hypothetical protein